MAVPTAVGGLVNDLDKFFCAQLEVGQGAALHAAGAVKNQNNVGGVCGDIGCGGQGQRHIKGAVTVDLSEAGGFIGVGYTHIEKLLSEPEGSPQNMPAGADVTNFDRKNPDSTSLLEKPPANWLLDKRVCLPL